MIDNYLLEELVAVADTGTLSKAAKKVGLSQAALSRGTKKIEEVLGIKLFIRKPNRISLTETGEFAVTKARKVLEANQNFSTEVNNFDQNLHQISLASIAPGPLILLKQFTNKNLNWSDTLLKQDEVTLGLKSHKFSCIISNEKISDHEVASSYLGSESLIVHLNQFSNLASQESVSFKDLAGLSFVVLSDIGIWTEIIQQNIPNAKFLYQQNESNFNEIRNNSIFPFFTTNITENDYTLKGVKSSDRVPVRISDPAAKMKFYLLYLKENQSQVASLVEQLQQAFARINK